MMYEVEMKRQAVCSPLARVSPLAFSFTARATLQVTVLADQEFRNYSIIVIGGQTAPSPSLCSQVASKHKLQREHFQHKYWIYLVRDGTPVRPRKLEDCTAV